MKNSAITEFGEALGGAIYSRSPLFNMNNWSFIRNKVEAKEGVSCIGGTVFLLKSTNGLVTRCVFDSNNSTNNGECYSSAIFLREGSWNFTQRRFYYNHLNCYMQGFQCIRGVICVIESSRADFNDCNLISNSLSPVFISLGVCFHSQTADLLLFTN